MATGDMLQCFMLIETDGIRRSLRRYAPGSCGLSGCGYHNAQVEIEPATAPIGATTPWYESDAADPRWPRACACSFEFLDSHERQVFAERLYKCSNTEALSTFREAPAGAFCWADYLKDSPGSIYHRARGGGPHLFLRCPGGGWWDLDAKASNGEGWEWKGVPPLVSATPSIVCNSYHGFLTDGVLREC